MYRDQVIALLKDQLTLEVETVSYYEDWQLNHKKVIHLCLDGETISAIDLEEF